MSSAHLPPEIDTSKPHSARMYHYFPGGKDNSAADRDTASKTLQAWPRCAPRRGRTGRSSGGRAHALTWSTRQGVLQVSQPGPRR